MTTTDTLTDAERYARLIRNEVLGLEHGFLDGYADELAEHDPADRPYEAAMRWLNDLALDVEVTRSLGTGDVTAVTITRTLGGPWCAVTFAHYAEHTVAAAWGRDRATVEVYGREVATVADVILDYFAEVSA
jgi:hypothetical protein